MLADKGSEFPKKGNSRGMQGILLFQNNLQAELPASATQRNWQKGKHNRLWVEIFEAAVSSLCITLLSPESLKSLPAEEGSVYEAA